MNKREKLAILETYAATLRQFMCLSQRRAFADAMQGEEGEFFCGKLIDLAKHIQIMPATYETDGAGENALAHLHYFKGGADWYITEKDSDDDGEGQLQAFGVADLGMGPELGYICIPELLSCGVELDLYWTPKPLKECTRGA